MNPQFGSPITFQAPGVTVTMSPCSPPMMYADKLPQGATIKLRHEGSGGFIQIKPDGSINAKAGRTEPEMGMMDVFIVHRPDGEHVKFQNAANPARWICLMTNDCLIGTGLGGDDCVFKIDSRVGTFAFGSKFQTMWHVGFDGNGDPKRPSSCFLGRETEFSIIPAVGSPQPPHPMGMAGAQAGYVPPPQQHGPHGVAVPTKVLRAVYGVFSEHSQMKDVTQICQSLVSADGVLNLGGGFNSHFGDPAPGIKKGLMVIWRNSSGLFSHILVENESPSLNLMTHFGTRLE